MTSDARRGFTLIEVLVAFAIMAFSLVAAYEVFSDASRAVASGEDEGVALALAQAKLAEIDGYPLDQPLAASGEFDEGFRWRIETQDFPGATPNDAQGPEPVLVIVVVEIPSGRKIALETIRLRRGS